MHSIRSTQRPPRSCIRCAKRRVRCDKKIPCQECISRGLELTCERETVRVKGKLITPTISQPLSGPSYQDLLEENQRLKAQIAGQTKPALDDEDSQHGEILNITESFENELFIGVDTSGRTPTVQSEADIYWPSRNCVMNLITYGRTWTSWIHYALHHPTFEAECEDFLNRGVEQRSQAHPLWLAIYFSFMSAVLIFMDDSEAQAAGISDDANVLLLNWYDSSLYFLDKAEFLRHHDPRSVQTIAILGIVFNNVGEIKFHHTLWGAAIRIAQFLKMDDDRAHPNETPLETQLRRRLWWTLIICEWLPAPFHRPCINEDDFRVKFPDVIDDEELVSPSTDWDPRPRQVQYHIAMSQLCTVIHRFRCSLKQSSGKTTDIVALVSKADENLATLIGELPPHLQGGQGAIESSQNETVSWMWWQKINLSLVLFYHRIVINRTLQDHWVQDPATFARTRAICLGAARSIIALSAGCTKSLARHRPWGTSLHLFCAGIILAIELKFHADDAKAEYLEDIKVCIKFLNGVKVQSSLAARAVEMLQAQISDLGIDEKLP